MSKSQPIPFPRNSVELPLFVFLTWGFWPPLVLVLGIPYRDLDDRFATHRLVPDREHPEADLVIHVARPRRRGPKRGSGSEQLILDIGADRPSRALAMVLLWRDRGIVQGRLGEDELRDETGAWWRRELEAYALRIRQHRTRLGRRGQIPAPQWMPVDPRELRRAAVIAARGAAARCGKDRAEQLLRDAFARYAEADADLSEIELPAESAARHHPAVRHLAHHFVQPGGRLANYDDELTHVLVHDPEPAVREVAESRFLEF